MWPSVSVFFHVVYIFQSLLTASTYQSFLPLSQGLNNIPSRGYSPVCFPTHPLTDIGLFSPGGMCKECH